MATCPSCQTRSCDGIDFMDVTRVPRDESRTPLAVRDERGELRIPELRLSCNVCHWSIDGWIDDVSDDFVGLPESQRWPQAQES